MEFRGVVADQVLGVMAEYEFFRDWQAGRSGHDRYIDALEAHLPELEERFGGPWIPRFLVSRYPSSFDENVETITRDLHEAGFVGSIPPWDGFEAFRQVMRERYDHAEKCTSINHDEAWVLYNISAAVRPRRLVAIGSYYGYWTAWAMPGVEAADGKAVLIDPDEGDCALAQHNFDRLGHGQRTMVVPRKAEDVLPRMKKQVDMVLLDAAGSHDHPDPTYRGKGIYAHLIGEVFDKLKDGGLLVVHNDYRRDVGGNRLCQAELDEADAQLAPFHEFCAGHFRKCYVAATPDGVGVYLK